jgi:hypothetical protein
MVMNLKGKEKENETALSKKLFEALEIEDDQKYADLTVTFSHLDKTEILKDTPPVRVHFKE